jgi:hydroxybutyrate-dimer hydrolase
MCRLARLLLLLVLLCFQSMASGRDFSLRPEWLGEVTVQVYDGVSNDLLTAGLGKTGLASPIPPPLLSDAAADLRRLAIYNNYRALVDVSPGGGYGVLFGPNVDVNGGGQNSGQGMVTGSEYLAYADDGSGRENVTLMVQVPASFDPARACIVGTASSGSRGIYGAIGTAGEWGLKHGCAVATADKGTGNGIHDLDEDTVNLQDGRRAQAKEAGKASNFSAAVSGQERESFRRAWPRRFAFKHAHSQLNPEKDWGRDVLRAIEFALYVLNTQYGGRLGPDNTLTIASGVSNGGGAALAAAEQDEERLIDGVAVAEPNVTPPAMPQLRVQRGKQLRVNGGRNLLQHAALANLYQPCAALANLAGQAFNTIVISAANARCQALAERGLVKGKNLRAQAESAQQVLLAAGFEPESRPLHAAMFSFATPALVAAFANAYGRFSVLDNLCGWSFAGSKGALSLSFALGNGIAPTLGIDIVRNIAAASDGGHGRALLLPLLEYDLEGALCVGELVSGDSSAARRVRQGMQEVSRSANLQGRPALIVHGRADTLIPVGVSVRPYYGANQLLEGAASRLRYIEVEHAQHFDAFLTLPGFAENYIPLHVYFVQAMDRMFAHLSEGEALPESQVVRTKARGKIGVWVNPLTARHVPPMKLRALPEDRIHRVGNTVRVPD